MERIKISKISDFVGQEVLVKGFVDTIRDQGKILFLILRDVSGVVQLVVLPNKSEVRDKIKSLQLESVVSVKGLAKKESQAPTGYEIEVSEIEILSSASPELPIPVVVKSGEETEMTKRFDYRWLDLRKPEKKRVFEVWTHLEAGFRKYYLENDFLQVYSPSFMVSPSESGSEVFEVKYFEKKAYLAQSPQFYKQMAMSSGFEKVFISGPVFRAEPSYTTRHMTEFTGWDFEISYIDSHYDVMATLEKVINTAFLHLSQKMPDLMVDLPKSEFPKLTMQEAKSKLKEIGVIGEKEHDLSPEEEREICKLVKEETDSDFVWIINYDISIRPFYHMRFEDSPKTTKSFDLLYKGIEVVTGAQREHRYDVLLSQAKEKNMNVEQLEDYLNFFKYGCPPHGGVGIGPGRIIMKMLDLESVKETAFLPRDVKRLRP